MQSDKNRMQFSTTLYKFYHILNVKTSTWIVLMLNLNIILLLEISEGKIHSFDMQKAFGMSTNCRGKNRFSVNILYLQCDFFFLYIFFKCSSKRQFLQLFMSYYEFVKSIFYEVFQHFYCWICGNISAILILFVFTFKLLWCNCFCVVFFYSKFKIRTLNLQLHKKIVQTILW